MPGIEDLEAELSRPSPALVSDLRGPDGAGAGDIVVLGAAGKLGPTLVRMAVRALSEAYAHRPEGSAPAVHAVSRFSAPGSAEAMSACGATVVPADLSDDDALADLPDAPNVVYLVGAKFGTSGNEPAAWATNTYLPGRIAARYAGSRIVALSTGNVYPLAPIGRAPDENAPVGPVGDYAMSCLGRERILTHMATTHGTPTALIRLNYAVENRYGVLVDIGRSVLAGEPVDLTTGFVNVVWQRYANEVILRSLLQASVPPFVLNLTGPETLSVRAIAERFGRILGKPVEFTGTEAASALLSDASRCHALFGYPDRSPDELIEDIADWLAAGGPVLDKPTRFQARDGKF